MISRKTILTAFEEIVNDYKVKSVVVFCYHRGGETECVRIHRTEKPGVENEFASEYVVTMGALATAERNYLSRYKGSPKPIAWIKEW